MKKNTKDDLGDRMKGYERMETSPSFMPRIPIYVRIDGRGFSKFTKGLRQPYDERLSFAMIETTKKLVGSTSALIGYTQSDEISLVYCPEDENSNIIFGGKKQKMISVLSGMATAFFHQALISNELADYCEKNPHFDCRAFQVPSKTEACNALLWRELDAHKNSISMATRSLYTTQEMYKKNASEMIDMIQSRGIDFADYPRFFRLGSFVKKQKIIKSLTDEEMANIPLNNRPKTNSFERSSVEVIEMSSFREQPNREDIVFG